MASKLDLARLSMEVYGGTEPEGWKIERETELDLTDSGLYAIAYRNLATDEIVIAYRGTTLSDTGDLGADIALTVDGTHPQFVDSLRFANQIKEKFGTDHTISVTGHSLGGALAQLAADVFGWGGVTFDAPGSAQLTTGANAAQFAAFFAENPGLSFGNVPTDSAVFHNRMVSGSVISNVGTHIGAVAPPLDPAAPQFSLVAMLVGWGIGGPAAALILGAAAGQLNRHSIAGIYEALKAESEAGRLLRSLTHDYVHNGIEGYSDPHWSPGNLLRGLFDSAPALTQAEGEVLLQQMQTLLDDPQSAFNQADSGAVRADLIAAMDEVKKAVQDVTNVTPSSQIWTEFDPATRSVDVTVSIEHALQNENQVLKVELPFGSYDSFGQLNGFWVDRLKAHMTFNAERQADELDHFYVEVPAGQQSVTLKFVALADDDDLDRIIDNITFRPEGRLDAAASRSVSLTILDQAPPVPTMIFGTTESDYFPSRNTTATDGPDEVHALSGDDEVWGWAGSDLLYGDAGNDLLHGRQPTGSSATYLPIPGDHDTIYGGDGNDDLFGDEGNDRLFGEAGQDDLDGGLGRDWLDGGVDNDNLYGSYGADVLQGGAGRDYLAGDDIASPASIQLNGITYGAGNDTLHGGADNDILIGSYGDDSLYGDSGADLLFGDHNADLLAVGNDYLSGGAGLDELHGGPGEDTLSGGSGDDILLGEGDNDLLFGDEGADQIRGNDGDDVIWGGAGDDLLLIGDDGLDLIYGEAGADELQGNGGADILYGGDGDDVMFGDGAPEYATTPDGDDTLYGGAGSDNMSGNDGNDQLFGGSEGDLLFGDAGDDLLFGEAGDDEATGGTGSDVLYGGAGADLLLGGDGDDELYGEEGDDQLQGGTGNDTLAGGGGIDSAYGGSGDDALDGGGGQDFLYGENGNDTVLGGLGDDVLYGDEQLGGGIGDDLIRGGAGDDRLYGQDGNDSLFGDSGADDLYAGPGQDVLSGGPGYDELWGDTGSDTYRFGYGDEHEIIRESDPTGADTDRVEFAAGITRDDIFISRYQNDLLVGLSGTSDQLTVKGFYGNPSSRVEVFAFSDGSDLSTATGGDDFIFGTRFDDTIDGGDGADDIRSLEGNDLVYGGNGDDSLAGGADDDLLLGEFGNDVLAGDGGADSLSGGPGNDYLGGGEGADRLDGGPGDDRYSGDVGDGSRSADVFVVGSGSGRDIIEQADPLDVVEFGPGVSAADVSLSQWLDNDLRLSWNGGSDTLTFQGFFYTYFGDKTRTFDFRFADGSTLDLRSTTERDDYYLGTETADDIEVLAGADVAYGLEGDDIIRGAAGNDKLIGNEGADILYGDTGDDFLDGDMINARSYGADRLTGGEGADWLFGRGGDDRLDGGAGVDFIDGGSGDDYLDSGAGDDLLRGGFGNDTYVFLPGDGHDEILEAQGTSWVDVVRFEAGISPSDFTAAQNGDDLVLIHSNGADSVRISNWFFAGAPDYYRVDRVQFGDGGAAIVWTEAELTALSGTPRVNGDLSITDFDDTALQAAEVTVTNFDPMYFDLLFTAPGGTSATFDPVLGQLQLTGAATKADYAAALSGVHLTTRDSTPYPGGFGKFQYRVSDGLTWSDPAVQFWSVLGSGQPPQPGGDGPDVLSGGAGADQFDGGAGNDTLLGRNGDDYLLGGAGLDTLRGGTGDDRLAGGADADRLYGGRGADVLRGDDGDDLLHGNRGQDLLYGGVGNDTLKGGRGADRLVGEEGEDLLQGGYGDDVYYVDSWSGQDQLQERGGQDRLLYRDVAQDALWFERSGQDLLVKVIGQDSSVRMQGWYDSQDKHVESIEAGGYELLDGQVDLLVQAMASLTPPAAGELELSPELRNELEPVLASAWQPAA